MENKWSRKHSRCRVCGTVERKHYALGLCRNCYRKHIYWQKPEEERTKRKEYYSKNPQTSKDYYQLNREKILRYQKIYYLLQKYKGPIHKGTN